MLDIYEFRKKPAKRGNNSDQLTLSFIFQRILDIFVFYCLRNVVVKARFVFWRDMGDKKKVIESSISDGIDMWQHSIAISNPYWITGNPHQAVQV